MSDPNKQTTRNILSVVTGVLTAVAFFLIGGLILLLSIASKVKGHGEESDLGNITLSGMTLFCISCISGGFITGKISAKSDFIHGAITGLVLIVLFAYMNNFNYDKESVLTYLMIIPVTLIGTYIAVRLKRKDLQQDY